MSLILVVKIGGAAITDKASVKTLRSDLETIARSIALAFGNQCERGPHRLVLTHGAGSFGHHVATEYGFGSLPAPSDPRACTEVRSDVLELTGHVTTALRKLRVPATVLSPHSMGWVAAGPLECGPPFNLSGTTTRVVADAIVRQTVPVIPGDVVPIKGALGWAIMGGDPIAEVLSLNLPRDLSEASAALVTDHRGPPCTGSTASEKSAHDSCRGVHVVHITGVPGLYTNDPSESDARLVRIVAVGGQRGGDMTEAAATDRARSSAMDIADLSSVLKRSHGLPEHAVVEVRPTPGVAWWAVEDRAADDSGCRPVGASSASKAGTPDQVYGVAPFIAAAGPAAPATNGSHMHREIPSVKPMVGAAGADPPPGASATTTGDSGAQPQTDASKEAIPVADVTGGIGEKVASILRSVRAGPDADHQQRTTATIAGAAGSEVVLLRATAKQNRMPLATDLAEWWGLPGTHFVSVEEFASRAQGASVQET